ncbi:MAG: PepSY domain-containing protein [Chamaesiphon sp.]
MKPSKKLILIATVIGTLGLGSLARVVQAQQSQPQVVASHHTVQLPEASDGDGEVNDTTEGSKLTGQNQTGNSNRISAKLPEASDGDGETNDDGQQQNSQLQSLAKVTRQQAQQVAEAAQKGRVSSVKLENEDNNLIYAVMIGQKEVKVDAGNGRILSTTGPNDENNEGVLHSSIQVPKSSRKAQ